jgi:methyl-accepting chemotaxis protein
MMKQLSLKQSLLYSALLICTLLLAGNVVIWRSSSALAVAADDAARAEQAIRLFKDSRYHVVQIQQFLTDAAAVGEASFSEAGEHRTQALNHIDRLAALVPERQAALRQLGDAVRRIREIADQTNLLALNAAIEAARAARRPRLRGGGRRGAQARRAHRQ